MHELSICKAILDTIQRLATDMKCSTIISVNINIGELSCVDKHALLFAFDAVTKGTIAENSLLNINEIQAKTECLVCDKTVFVSQFYAPCPNCGTITGELVQGNELIIESMAVE